MPIALASKSHGTIAEPRCQVGRSPTWYFTRGPETELIG